jgi:hypothetical protein
VASDHEHAILDAALEGVGRGWSIVPMHTPLGGGCSCRRPDCPAVGKHPRVQWDARMRAPATREQVQAWWRRWPDANVGVVTGAVSGAVVVDVDPRNGGAASLGELCERFETLPRTAEARTGGGGRHLWFAPPAHAMPSAILAAGLELKGEGGIVVVPPSLHRSGRRYAWVPGRGPNDLPLALLPSFLAALASGARGIGADHGLEDPPPRTAREQAEFAEAWARAGIRLQPGDRYYLCPFHPDHRPSLHVDADGCRWFCFGCRRGGGIGRLVQLVGDGRTPRPWARLRGRVGADMPVTLVGERRTEVLGESHHQDALLELSGGRRSYGGVELEAVAELVPDPEDPERIGVLIEGREVGELPLDESRRLARAVREATGRGGAATCRALIRGGWDRGGDDVGFFGVVLLTPGRSGSDAATVTSGLTGIEP